MDKVLVVARFEYKNINIDDNFLANLVEFGIRSMYGLIGGSLIFYEILAINPPLGEVTLTCESTDTYKISSALALISSYGASRVKIITKIIE
jgi:RNase P/RNase MRP subunit POP5